MDARDRWQALQARLTAARAALDTGDRAKAIVEITAALELDKDFLAAQALHDRLLAMTAQSSRPAPAHPAPSHLAPENVPPAYEKFEQRARRRRVDRRVDAARAAIAQQRVKVAAAALDEVIDLDPNLPELAELTAQFDRLRRSAATPHRGPKIAAAAVFVAALFGASVVQDASPVHARQFAMVEPPAQPSSAIAAIDDPLHISEMLAGHVWSADTAAEPAGFDACDPRVEGDVATAVCRAAGGTWNVRLRKVGGGWKVETARADRLGQARILRTP